MPYNMSDKYSSHALKTEFVVWFLLCWFIKTALKIFFITIYTLTSDVIHKYECYSIIAVIGDNVYISKARILLYFCPKPVVYVTLVAETSDDIYHTARSKNNICHLSITEDTNNTTILWLPKIIYSWIYGLFEEYLYLKIKF